MKFSLFNTALICLAALGLASCSGNVDSESAGLPVLKADKSSIEADGKDAVVFTVEVDGSDVTSESQIQCISHKDVSVSEAVFVASVPGIYKFTAEYGGNISKSLEINVVKTENPDIVSKFARKVCVIDFTGQWCSQCPLGYAYLSRVTSMQKYKGKVYIMAMHNQDDMSIPVESEMASNFKIQGYPSAVVDFRDVMGLTNDATGQLPASLDASLKEYKSHCGVAVRSDYDRTSGKVSVTARLMPEISSEYALSVWVVENDITAWQNDGGLKEPNYKHKHVARKHLTAWRGEKLGTLGAGKECVKNYEFQADPLWNIENSSIFVLAIDADGHVNNVNECKIVGGDSDYIYAN